MDAALARAMHDFATDPDLVAILSRAPTATPMREGHPRGTMNSATIWSGSSS